MTQIVVVIPRRVGNARPVVDQLRNCLQDHIPGWLPPPRHPQSPRVQKIADQIQVTWLVVLQEYNERIDVALSDSQVQIANENRPCRPGSVCRSLTGTSL